MMLVAGDNETGRSSMASHSQPLILLHPADGVAVARRMLKAGAETGIGGLCAREPIPRGHKIALKSLRPGEAVRKFGGTQFKVPPGGYFLKIDRFSGGRLPDDATGDHVVAEYFRDGVEPMFGFGALVDGGFGMGSNLPLFGRGETDFDGTGSVTITTSTGQQRVIPGRADFGTLSSGGLY